MNNKIIKYLIYISFSSIWISFSFAANLKIVEKEFCNKIKLSSLTNMEWSSSTRGGRSTTRDNEFKSLLSQKLNKVSFRNKRIITLNLLEKKLIPETIKTDTPFSVEFLSLWNNMEEETFGRLLVFYDPDSYFEDSNGENYDKILFAIIYINNNPKDTISEVDCHYQLNGLNPKEIESKKKCVWIDHKSFVSSNKKPYCW